VRLGCLRDFVDCLCCTGNSSHISHGQLSVSNNTRCRTHQQVKVVEVDRPDRRLRRQRGKSDPIDAEAAARAVLAGVATAAPKRRDGIVESIRVLRTARSGAVKARTAAINQLKALLVTAPASLREALDGRSTRPWSPPVPGCAPTRPPWPIQSPGVQGRAGDGRPAHSTARGRDHPG
jgi:hypothetical protein